MVEGDSVACFLAHFKEQLPLYGEQVIVNLVDQKKAEGEMEANLKHLVAEVGLRGVKYVAFDFHTECKNMRFHHLTKLIDRVKPHIREHGYFFTSGNDGDDDDVSTSANLVTQKGLFRTNCMDCLDRTNVVQSLLAAENLELVLLRMGVLKPDEDVFKSEEFTVILHNCPTAKLLL